MEIIDTAKGKPALVLDGYRYRLHRTSTAGIRTWRCIKQRSTKCTGTVKTNASNVMFASTPHQCVPNVTEVVVEKTKFVCRKRAREEISTPVNQIYKQEFSNILNQGSDVITDVPKYSSCKTALCSIRRMALGTAQSPKTPGKVSAMKSGRSTYCQEKNKIEESIADPKNIFKPTMNWFHKMESLMKASIETKTTDSSEGNLKEDVEKKDLSQRQFVETPLITGVEDVRDESSKYSFPGKSKTEPLQLGSSKQGNIDNRKEITPAGAAGALSGAASWKYEEDFSATNVSEMENESLVDSLSSDGPISFGTNILTENADEYTLFGHYIACKLRKFNNKLISATAQCRISSYLYELEIGNLDAELINS